MEFKTDCHYYTESMKKSPFCRKKAAWLDHVNAKENLCEKCEGYLPSEPANIDIFVERERDWLVDIIAKQQICDFCAYDGQCEFEIKMDCFEGCRKWLLAPYDEDRWHKLR